MNSEQKNIDTENLLLDCDIYTRYHRIQYDCYIYSDSFNLPHKIGIFKFQRRFSVFPNEDDKQHNEYNPHWDVSEYQNQKTKNHVFFAISSKIFDKYTKIKIPRYIMRINYIERKAKITQAEIEDFLKQVKFAYEKWKKSLPSLPPAIAFHKVKPALAEIEIALDFYGSSVDDLHEKLIDSLFKERSRIRKHAGKDETHEDEEVYNEELLADSKPISKITPDGRTLLNAYQTNYISDSFRAYFYLDKHKRHLYRAELIMRKNYLKRQKVKSLNDYKKKINPAQYWIDKYFFADIVPERATKYLQKKYPEMVKLLASYIYPVAMFTPPERFNKLKQCEVNGKRIFSNPKRKLLQEKWYRVDYKIREALSTLSITRKKVKHPIPKRKGEEEKVTQSDMKRARIESTLSTLLKKKSYKTIREIAKLTKVSTRTIYKHKDLLDNYRSAFNINK